MPEIGDQLREARLRNRIDITEVEAATKIRAKYLRALENEEWDLLPGPTFVKTFLRTYADYLGLDSRVLVEEYRQRYERVAVQELTPFGTNLGGRRSRPRRSLFAPWMAVVAGVIVLVGRPLPARPLGRRHARRRAGRPAHGHRDAEAGRQEEAAGAQAGRGGQADARAAADPGDRAGQRVPGERRRDAADPQPDARRRPVEPDVPRPPLPHVLRHRRRRHARRREVATPSPTTRRSATRCGAGGKPRPLPESRRPTCTGG